MKTTQIISTLIVVAGIGLLFGREMYAVGAVVLCAALIVAGLALRANFRKPINYKSIEYRLSIKDIKGESAIFTKRSWIEIAEDNVTQIVDTDFTASGDLNFLSSNIGGLSSPTEEGGTYRVVTRCRTPLKKGEEYEHIIKMECVDSLIEERETLSVTPGYIREKFSAYVEFPESRACQTAEVHMSNEGRSHKLPPPDLDQSNQLLSFEVKDPEPGARYVLSWTW